MTDIDTDTWPTREGDTVITRRDAVVGPPTPPPEPDRRLGAGMLLALTVIALTVAGAAIAYFLTHGDTSSQVTTVVVRSTAPTGTTKKVVPNVAATNAKTTATAPSTTAPSTTAPSTTTAPATPTTPPPPPQPTTATMPDVSSQKEAAAVQALNEAGILPSLFFVPGSDPLGTVTGQAKSAGTTVAYHSHVQVNVSSGPGDKPQEQVPSVVGQTLQQAVSSLNGANLRLIYVKYAVNSRSQAGKIVQQSPLGGGHAPQNAQVLVFLGAYRG